MVFEEREELYLALSKKDLMELCRSHGLPCGNATKGRLANILVAHFNGRERPLEESLKASRKRGRPRLTSLPQMERTKESDEEGDDLRRSGNLDSNACKQMQYCTQDVGAVGETAYLQVCQHGNEESGCCGDCQSHLATENMLKNLPVVRGGNGNSNEISSGSGLASSSELLTDAPASFQFFVRAEEGIRLYIDLNSSPSNWVKQLNDEVLINQKAHRDKAWSICNELRDTCVKDVEILYEENTDTSKNISEPPTEGFYDGKWSSKSSLTSILRDKGGETMELFDERNQPSSSYAHSSGTEYYTNSGLRCSLPALLATQSMGKDTLPINKSWSSGDRLYGIIFNHTHIGGTENLSGGTPVLNMEPSDNRSAESGSKDKSPVSMSGTSGAAPNICHDVDSKDSEGIQTHIENGSSSVVLLDAEVQEKNSCMDQQDPRQPVSEPLADIMHFSARNVAEDLPQDHTRDTLASSISENMSLVPMEGQCNNQCVEENPSSGESKYKQSRSMALKRSSERVVSDNKKNRASQEASQVSMINLRSRKTLAKGPVYGSTAFPRRSKRLVLKV